jgi:RHS repeat-associated protein
LSHTLALTSGGLVYAWGRNSEGEVGTGTAGSDVLSPQEVPGLTEIISVAAGGLSSYALKSDGTVYSWGNNPYGQLGNGSVVMSASPQQVPSLTSVVSIAAGSTFVLALKTDGSVWSWGQNSFGQLGTGQTDLFVPTKITTLTGVTAIGAGTFHGLAVQSDGGVYAWGYNGSGQLGFTANGSTPNWTPVLVSGVTAPKAVFGGVEFSAALMSDGTVKEWGDDTYGQLGNGANGSSYVPAAVPSLSGVASFSVGKYHAVASFVDGTAKAWGINNLGQVGSNSSTASYQSPTSVYGLAGTATVSAGYNTGYALLSDGQIKAWGYNDHGQVGPVGTYTAVPYGALPVGTGPAVPAPPSAVVATPADASAELTWDSPSTNGGVPIAQYLVQPYRSNIAGLARFTGTSATSYTATGLINASDYNFTVAGMNCVGTGSSSGQSSAVQPTTTTVPAQVSCPSFQTVAGGRSHTVAIKGDGTVWSWGLNGSGQLGNGTTTQPASPGIVRAGTLTNVLSVAASWYSSYALTSDGTVWSWGSGVFGTLGTGNTNSSSSPVKVAGLTGVKAISASYYSALALKNDGTVWGWGLNTYGRLGNGTGATVNSPVRVSGFSSPVVAISEGYLHGLALTGDGTVWSWGNNTYGQLGDESTTDSANPVPVMYGASNVAAGGLSSYAIKADGSAWSWGYNLDGELGNGSWSSTSAPAQITGLDHIQRLSAGDLHALALRTDTAGTTIRAWGDNSRGQLGNGSTTDALAPVTLTASSLRVMGIGALSSYALQTDSVLKAWGANESGQLGDSSATDRTTPVTVGGSFAGPSAPGAPGTPSGSSRDGGAALTWTAPGSTGGLPISQYTITPYLSGQAQGAQSTGSAVTSFTATGLTNNVGYTFAVAANTCVASTLSAATGSITPTGVPGIPTAVTATPSNGSVQVAWTAPAANGNASPSGYTVTPAVDGNPLSPVSVGQVSSVTVQSLANGTPYTFTVAAVNGVGSGALSPSTTAVIPNVVAGAPGTPTGTAGAGEATLSWTAPAPNGATLDEYELTPYINGVAQTTVKTGSAATIYKLSSLTPGTTYRFAVAARNSMGAGTQSAQSQAISLNLLPGAPGVPTVTAGNGAVDLSWAAPADNGSGSITGYSVDQYSDDRLQRTVPGTTATTLHVSGLQNGFRYTFRVAAANATGRGPASSASPAVTPATSPGQVTGVSVQNEGAGTVYLAWTAPTDNGGAPIDHYRVTPYIGSAAQSSIDTGSTDQVHEAAPYFTVGGLNTSTSYTFKVAAVNAIGAGIDSVASQPVIPGTLPAAPALLGFQSGDVGDRAVTVRWAALQDQSLTAYVVYPFENGIAKAELTAPPSSVSLVVPNLINGRAYVFAVAARNAAGTGPRSATSAVAVPDILPNAPGNLAGVAGPGSVSLTWAAPTTSNATPVTQYVVYLTAGGHTGTALQTGTSATSLTIPNLSNQTLYTFRVAAQNGRGVGATTASVSTTPTAPSSCITALAIAAGATHSLEVTTDNTVWAWGDNASGAVGDGTNTTRFAPVQVKGYAGTGVLSGIVDVKGGNGFSLALQSNGTVWAWGAGTSGQLGNQASNSSSTPVPVSGLPSSVIAIAAGGSHAMALSSAGKVYTWGSDVSGQLGDGGTNVNRNSAAEVWGLSGITSIAAGLSHSLAIGSSGLVYGWGDNTYGQVGDGATTETTPTEIPGVGAAFFTDAADVAAGSSDSIALKTDGTVWAWGRNHVGQLGNGNQTNQNVPVQVKNSAGTDFLTGISKIDAGWVHNLAVTPDQSQHNGFGWGGNATGPIGNGSTASTVSYPATIDHSAISAVAGGRYHSLITQSNYGYSTWAMGDNSFGQLGIGNASITQETSPTQTVVPGQSAPGGVSSISGTPGDGMVHLSWTAPNSGGRPAQYVIAAYSSGSRRAVTTPTDATSYDYTGLTNGQPYTFTIAAQNCFGTGAASSEVGPYTPNGNPAGPLAVLAYPGNQQIRATWAPSPTPGVQSYRASVFQGETEVALTSQKVPASQQSITFSGLTNGTEYTIRVSASLSAASPAPLDTTYGAKTVSNKVTPLGLGPTAATSDGLGLERFYPYQKAAMGTGTQYTNLFTGNNVVQFTDVSLPAQGLNMVLKRTYNSQRRDRSDVLGAGWLLSVSDGSDAAEGIESGITSLSVNDAISYLPFNAGTSSPVPADFWMTDGDGTTHVFHSDDALASSPVWSRPDGVNLTLRGGPTGGFTLIRPDGVSYNISNTGSAVVPDYRLVSIKDRNLNELDFTYEANGLLRHRLISISNASAPSRRLTLSYRNPSNVVGAIGGALGESTLTSITGPDSRRVDYGVTSADGLDTLTEVTVAADSTADKSTNRYTYDATGLLTTVRDPRSSAQEPVPYLTTFTYTSQSGHPSPLLTTVTDRRAKAWNFYYGGSADEQHRTRVLSGTPAEQTTVATDPERQATSYLIRETTDDVNGNLIALTDAGDNNGRNMTHYVWTTSPRNRLQELDDPRGNATTYAYDSLGDVTQVVRPGTNGSGANSSPITSVLTYCYSQPADPCTTSESGQAVADLVLSQAASGTDDQRTTTYDHDSGGNVTLVTQAANPGGPSLSEERQTHFDYYDRGRLKSITDTAGNVTTYGDDTSPDHLYDPSGQPIKITDAVGNAKSFSFDAHGNLTSTNDRDGHVTTMTYTARDQLATSTDALGHTTTSSYDANGNKATSRTPRGLLTKFSYDTTDNLVETRAPAGFVSTAVFNDDGTRRSTTTPKGNAERQESVSTTTWLYFPNNRVRQLRAPADSPQGPSIGMTDYIYLPDGKVQQVTAPGTSSGGRPVHTATWTPAGLLASESEQDGVDVNHPNESQNTTYYCYDAVGNQVMKQDPRAGTGQPTCPPSSGGSAQAFVTRSSFDHLNQLSQQLSYVRDNETTILRTLTSSFSYDAVGNQATVSQPTGDGKTITTHTQYDQLNRIRSTDDPTNPGHTSVFTYTPEGRQKVRDDLVNGGLERRTAQAYNDDGRLRSTDVGKPDPNAPSGYSELISTRNYTGQDVQAGYDGDGNLLRRETWLVPKNSSTAAVMITSEDMSYYDNRDLLKSYAETSRGGPAGTAMPNYICPSACSESVTQDYTYDEDGNLTSRKETSFDTATTSYSYSPSGNLKSLTSPDGGKQVTYSYELGGQVASMNFPNGVTAASKYRQTGLRSALTSMKGSTTQLSYTGISYDPDHNKVSEQVSALQPAAAAKGGSATYAYDELDRLTAYASPFADTGNNRQSTSYVLDDAGNIVAETEKLGNATTKTTSTFDSNRLTGQDVVGAQSYGSTFRYDGLGQQLSRKVGSAEVDTSAYDIAGQTASHSPASATDPTQPGSTTVTYLHDGAGRILQRAEGGNVFIHIYTGPNSSTLADELSAASIQMRYVSTPGGQILEQDDEAAGHSTHGWSWLGYDSRGNVANRTDANGAILETKAYSPYGKEDTNGSNQSDAQHTTSPLGFQGAWKDTAGQQYSIGARMYDPSVGRFTTADSYAGAGLDLGLNADALTGNRYLYAGANPAGYFDDGHQLIECTNNCKPQIDHSGSGGSGSAGSTNSQVDWSHLGGIDWTKRIAGTCRYINGAAAIAALKGVPVGVVGVVMVCYVYDNQGHLGKTLTWGLGEGTVFGRGGSAGVAHLAAWGGSIDALAGPFAQGGGSVGTYIPGPVSAGADSFTGQNNGAQVWGYTIGGGVTWLPGYEGHVVITMTKLIDLESWEIPIAYAEAHATDLVGNNAWI